MNNTPRHSVPSNPHGRNNWRNRIHRGTQDARGNQINAVDSDGDATDITLR